MQGGEKYKMAVLTTSIEKSRGGQSVPVRKREESLGENRRRGRLNQRGQKVEHLLS